MHGTTYGTSLSVGDAEPNAVRRRPRSVAVAGALLLLGLSSLTAASRAPSARGPAAGIALSDTRGGDAGASDAPSRRAPSDMAETTVAVAMACGTPRIALVCHADLVFSAGDDVALNSTSIRYYPVAENGPPSKLAPLWTRAVAVGSGGSARVPILRLRPLTTRPCPPRT